MPHRDFDAERRERERLTEPLTFTFGGQDFTCLPLVEVGAVMALAEAPEVDDDEAAGVAAILHFVGHLVAPEDRDRWRWASGQPVPGRGWWLRLRYGRRERLDPQAVVDLGGWLAEQYAGRPFVLSTDSLDSPRSDGASTTSPAGNGSASVSVA